MLFAVNERFFSHCSHTTPWSFSKNICLLLCLFLSSCFHAVKVILLEATQMTLGLGTNNVNWIIWRCTGSLPRPWVLYLPKWPCPKGEKLVPTIFWQARECYCDKGDLWAGWSIFRETKRLLWIEVKKVNCNFGCL